MGLLCVCECVDFRSVELGGGSVGVENSEDII